MVIEETDDAFLIQTTGTNSSVAYMGLLTDLLAWHIDDPVDSWEQRRNHVVYGFQGNRNPFIDNPQFVCDLYNIVGCGGTEPTPTPTPTPTPPPSGGEVWINEFHYDNSSTDTGEFVEVAGNAGTSLSGWTVLGYNGNGGGVYSTVNLNGTLPDQDSGYVGRRAL